MKKAAGQTVENVHVRNPRAVAIVNERARRDMIPAATAAALIILESQNRPDYNPNRGAGSREKPAFLSHGDVKEK